MCLAYVFDRATIGVATFSTMATEGTKVSCDSVVMMMQVSMGLAGAFLSGSHTTWCNSRQWC